jgi:hypothetical protein
LEGNDEKNATLKPTSQATPATGGAPGPALVNDNDAAWKTMMTALGALSLSTAATSKKRRLPFLRRVARTSFLRRCKMIGLAVNSVPPKEQILTILYKLPIDISDNEWDNEVTEFLVHEVKLGVDQLVCPLCDTLGCLVTKEMLEAHMEWDHLEVEASWRKAKDGVSRNPLVMLLLAHEYRAGSLRWNFLEMRGSVMNQSQRMLNRRGK